MHHSSKSSYGVDRAQKVQEVRDSAGEPLPPSLRNRMEGHFGHDFSNVRVHADAGAAESAKSLHAKAYTTGSHLVFGTGKYEPGSSKGRELIGHELAHVIQQREVLTGDGGPGEAEVLRDHDLEQAARVAGDSAARDNGASTVGANTPPTPTTESNTIQCADEEDTPWWQSALKFGATHLPIVGEPLDIMFDTVEGMEAGAKGKTGSSALSFANAATGMAGFAAGLGGFEMLGTGGLTGAISAISSGGLGTLGTVGGLGAEAGATLPASAALGGAGLEGAAALGPGAAVAGAFLGGIGGGMALDAGVNKLGQAITGDEKGDYSISAGIANVLTNTDQTVSSLFADPSKPAYTQTLGWKLANLFD
jgi:hypothetical protein